MSILAVFLFINCDSSLDPLEKREGSFSIFGTIDMETPVKYFRIDDLNKTLYDEETLNFDGKVTLRNLNTGDEEILPSDIVLFDKIYTYNFYTTNIEYDTKYELNIERISDGNITKGSWITPAKSDITIDAGPIATRNCHSKINVVIKPIKKIEEIDFRIFSSTSRRYLALQFELKDDGSAEAFFTVFDAARGGSGLASRACDNFENSSKELSIVFTHYGPDYFEDNYSGKVDDAILVKYLGAFYTERLTFKPYDDE